MPRDLEAQYGDHPLATGATAIVNVYQFQSIEQRDRLLAQWYPGRRCSDVPGVYDLPNGGTLSVLLLEAREYAPEQSPPMSDRDAAALERGAATLDDDEDDLEAKDRFDAANYGDALDAGIDD